MWRSDPTWKTHIWHKIKDCFTIPRELPKQPRSCFGNGNLFTMAPGKWFGFAFCGFHQLFPLLVLFYYSFSILRGGSADSPHPIASGSKKTGLGERLATAILPYISNPSHRIGEGFCLRFGLVSFNEFLQSRGPADAEGGNWEC